MPPSFQGALVVVSIIVISILAGCGSDGDRRTLRVFAAASLTDSFADLAEAFEAENPGVRVELNLAGSSSLREQILEGAPADVFASANEQVMDDLVAAAAVSGDPAPFASNRLALAVPAGNPADVDGLADLADAELLVGLCASQVPCGQLASEALGMAGVTAAPDTTEPDVRALLAKVEAGELDVGLIYASDVVASTGGVEVIAAPALDGHSTRYPVAVLSGSTSPALADAFMIFVLSPEGRAILDRHGFGR